MPGPVSIRSSLFSHSFPTFYACYLLKSAHTPSAKSTYIGSTPCPPRRIRQHNGELTQGARKTRLKRPWVMQMIVHGFPSRLAALQFEWAWQHPHKSRHMRDGKTSIFGSRAHKTLSKNILIVRTMISRPPFNTWPLHVKLFTHEAHQHWEHSTTNGIASPLPPGFTCTLELEGVDGKSGHVGSGRQGPISVNDEQFESKILDKKEVLAVAWDLECTVCRKSIRDYDVSSLLTALCPSRECYAVSHLICLSHYFLNQQDRPTIVPRGGRCKSCSQYTLWGDVIRGCYLRMPPSDKAVPVVDLDTDDMFASDNLEVQEKTKPSRRMKKNTPSTERHKSPKKGRKQRLRSSTRRRNENFDLSDLNTSSEGEDIPAPVKRKPGRPPKNPAILSSGASSSVSSPQPLKVPRQPKRSVPPAKPKLSTKGKGNQSPSSLSTSEGETFDFDNLVTSLGSKTTSAPVKRKRGRPSKNVSLSPGLAPPIVSTRPHISLDTYAQKRKLSKERGKQKRAFSPISLISSSEDETIDLSNLVASPQREDTSTSVKRQRGRPRKILVAISPPIESGQASKGENDLTDIGSRSDSVKIKPRRSAKNMPLLSPKITQVPPLTRTYHSRCRDVEAESEYSSSGEFFDFGGIHDSDDSDVRNRSSGRTVKRGRPLHRKANPGIVTRDFRGMHEVERAMSAISLSPRQKTPPCKGREVIEVSD